jgi:CarD family transcriptional regulator
MFKVMDYVVYPGHGVAVIQEAIEQKIGTASLTFFKLHFKYKDMNILVPQQKMENCGVRFVSDAKDIEAMFSELGAEEETKKACREYIAVGWSKRQKEYQAKIDSGVLLGLASTYRDLKRFSEVKSLSFGEKGILFMAEELLSQEIAEVTKTTKIEALTSLRYFFEKKEEVFDKTIQNYV